MLSYRPLTLLLIMGAFEDLVLRGEFGCELEAPLANLKEPLMVVNAFDIFSETYTLINCSFNWFSTKSHEI